MEDCGFGGDSMPPVSYLRERLIYDEVTGRLCWLPRPESDFNGKHQFASWSARCEGKEAGTVIQKKRKQYRAISLCGRRHYAHRIAWAIYHGKHPDAEIDHVNGNSMDNSIVNLREVVRQENCQNVKLMPDSRSGYCGVNWHAETGKWRARLKMNGREKYLGLFDDPVEAAARVKAARDAMGFHPEHGAPHSIAGYRKPEGGAQ